MKIYIYKYVSKKYTVLYIYFCNQREVSLMSAVNINLLVPGVTIYYHLLPSQLPRNPDREWKGCVLSVYAGMDSSLRMALVECLDDGYDRAVEFVLLSQITQVEG